MVNRAASTLRSAFPHSYAVVDVETSGLAQRRDRVLSVAVIQVGSDGDVEDTWSTLLDPGCDPGPVHVHGLTRERLAGSPLFGDIVDQLAARLAGRVFVAHNASFDWGFLAAEAVRAGRKLDVERRLCTRTLARRLDLPLANFKLTTLAEYCAVPFEVQHDALADARALASVLPHLLDLAAEQDLLLPFTVCEPAPAVHPTSAPKVRCRYLNPGPLGAAGLVRGMRIVVTGSTAVPRDQLVQRATAAGLDVTNTVSRRTSVVVTNEPAAGTSKLRGAAAHDIPIIDEARFLTLLTSVSPGRHRDAANADAAARATTPMPMPTPDQPVEAVVGTPGPVQGDVPDDNAAAGSASAGLRLLGVRRVLVLGGPHEAAAEIRRRVVKAGGLAAVNLTASVTDVVCLPGGEHDRRMARIRARGLPLSPAEEFLRSLDEPRDTAPDHVTKPETPTVPVGQVLIRGAVVDLPVALAGSRWVVAATWGWERGVEVDLTAFLTGEDDQVGADEDFVYYNQPQSADGGVTLNVDGPAEQSLEIDLAMVAPSVHRVVVAAALGVDHTFGDIGAVNIAVQTPDGRSWLQATLDAATTENTMILVEVYRRRGIWRLRAVGQGYDQGLPELARSYGVDVAG